MNRASDFAIDVRTPDAVRVKIEPSDKLLIIMVIATLVAAAWVKKKL